MLGLRCKDIENLLSSVGTRDFRYGPIAAPVTASSERPVSIGQLVTTCHHIMSGDFNDTGSVTPSFALTPDANSTWLNRTTASAPITPAAKQIATCCFTVTVKTPLRDQRPRCAPPSTILDGDLLAHVGSLGKQRSSSLSRKRRAPDRLRSLPRRQA